MKKTKLFLAILLFTGFQFLNAQGIVITGTVTDNGNGDPLPGVNVILTGTTTGTVTGLDGEYSIEVPDQNAQLTFSFVGYLAETRDVGTATVIDVTLNSDIQSLTEVVVVGYGTMEKTNVTGAISTVKSDDLSKAPVVNPLEALQGQVSGVLITKGSGMPGQGGTQIILRGKKTLSGRDDDDPERNNPLIIVDGVPWSGGNLAELNTEDIESMNILKDASAAAIYGKDAANGVILITTKTGNKGSARVSLNVSAGPTSMVNVPKTFNGDEYYELKREAFMHMTPTATNPTIEDVLTDPVEYENYMNGSDINWHDLLLRKGMQQNYSLTVSGGSEKFTYYLNGNAYREKGIAQHSDYNRYSFRMNTDYKPHDNIKVGARFQISQSKANETGNTLYQGNSDFTDFTGNTPLGRTHNDNEEILPTVKGDQFQYNPLFRYRESQADRFADRFSVTPYIEIKLLKGLTYTINGFAEISTSKWYRFESSKYRWSTLLDDPGNAVIKIELDDNKQYMLDNILNYTRIFGKHGINATIVGGLATSTTNGFDFNGEGGPILDLLGYYGVNSITSSDGSYSFNPYDEANVYYVGRAGYSYDSKYSFTGSFRLDGSSKFNVHRWSKDPFISFAFAWNIDKEQFLSDIDIISQLKFRASYGETGNDNINPFAARGATADVMYTVNGEVVAGKTSGSARNDNLKWEESHQINLGLDFGLYNQRISGVLDIYRTRNIDILVEEQIPSPTGFSNVLSNVGKVDTKGIEAALAFKVIDQNFKWDVSITGAADKNEIIKLSNADVDSMGNPINDEANGWFIGEDMDVIYDYKFDGIYQNSEEALASQMHPTIIGYGPGDPKIADVNGDGVITADDRTFVGSPTPSFYGGIRNTFSYKGLELTVLLETIQGVEKVNTNYGSLTGRDNQVKVNYWTPTNPSNEFPRPHAAASYYFANSVNLRDASFVSLRNISLKYNLPSDLLTKLPFKSASVYVQGNNLYYFSKYKDAYTPESNAGAYPMIRTIIFGTNINF